MLELNLHLFTTLAPVREAIGEGVIPGKYKVHYDHGRVISVPKYAYMTLLFHKEHSDVYSVIFTYIVYV